MRKGKISVMMLGLLSGCSSNSSSPSASPTNVIKIGAVAPLTGSIATFGNSAKNSLVLLEEQVNAAGGILDGKKIQFVIQDDQGDPSVTASVGQKLIDEKVVGIIGPLTSGSCKALGPIATAAKIPMVTGTGTEAQVTSIGGEYVFRTCFTDAFQGNVVSKFATEDLKAKTAAILYDNSMDYSKGLSDVFKASFEKLGGKVVDVETYNANEQDFNAQITKIKAQKPDVIFLPEYYEAVALIAKQVRAQGITSTLLGVDGWDSSKLVELGGAALNGGYYSNHYSPDDTSAEVVKFVSAYKAKYNAVPDALAALTYDAGQVLIEAVKKAGKTDGPSVQAALKATDITVVSGKIKFDANRDAVKSAVMLKVDNGKIVFAKKIDPQQ
jgi:branched-chain amino acid transport system substrate-binding protein